MRAVKQWTIVLLVLAALVLSACTAPVAPAAPAAPAAEEPAATAPAAEEAAPAEGDGMVIGFSQVTLDSPFYVELMKAAEAEAAAQGVEFIYVDAQGDIAKQNNDIQDLITRGVDVLILNAVNPEGVVPSIDALNAAGIPVVTVDRPITPKVASHVGRDNKVMGSLIGNYAKEQLGDSGKIIELQGDAGGAVMMARRDGFEEAFTGSGIEIVQGPYDEYIRANAVASFQDLLQANADVNLVYGHNDDMALGAVQVLESQGVTGVKVMGVDCLMEAVQAIVDGRYQATTANDPQFLGTLAVRVAAKVAAGEEVPDYVDAGSILITAENAQEFLNPDLVFCAYAPEVEY